MHHDFDGEDADAGHDSEKPEDHPLPVGNENLPKDMTRIDAAEDPDKSDLSDFSSSSEDDIPLFGAGVSSQPRPERLVVPLQLAARTADSGIAHVQAELGAVDAEDPQINWQHPGSHPLSIGPELSSEEAARASRYKLSYIRFLLRTTKWKDSVTKAPSKPRTVRASQKKTVKAATLLRLDGVAFQLVPSSVLFYVMFEATGLELIYVNRIYWASGQERKGEPSLWVDFTRVLSTANARVECDREEDLIETIDIPGGVVNTRRLGGKSLDRLLATQESHLPASSLRPTFHRGDCMMSTSASNIVGFVGWSHRDAHTAADSDSAIEKSLLPQIQQTQRDVSDIRLVDWVFCGSDFSDREPAGES
jgi:hypothetical protein